VDTCKISHQQLTAKGQIIAETEDAFLVESIDAPSEAWLIEPKEHVEDVLDLPDGWWASMKKLLPKVPGFMADTQRYNISINLGPAAGRRLPHLHFWIVRRDEGVPSTNLGLLGLIKLVDGKK
jgi:diadenosine tetraphosphate (Ap4A) HIT family hydrolase